MYGLRRYRLFLLVALLTIGTIYHLVHVRRQDFAGLDGLKSQPVSPNPGSEGAPPKAADPAVVPPPSPPKLDEKPNPNPVPVAKPTTPQSKSPVPTPARPQITSTTTTSAWEEKSTIRGDELLVKPPALHDEFGEEGLSRQEFGAKLKDNRRAHWRKPDEQFPLKAADIIPLPSGQTKPLPKIQADFRSEPSSEKKDRLSKLATIRESFKHAWNGYKKYGLPHDELQPISRGYSDPFMGWGATLVDSLDSLWIMGLKDEFEEAVKEVAKIDFTTSDRKDLPLFETVIRYLGGLIAAWDLSDGKYPILLNQTEALAEILIGAFDTPNRMPVPFYYWAPSYTSQAHRASAHIVMAELGSLSLEFTRLAQITHNNKYYDAVARITNELEKWQMQTSMPGLWPLKLDASGCKKTDRFIIQDASHDQDHPVLIGDDSLPDDDDDDDALQGTEPAVYRTDQKSKDALSPIDKRQINVADKGYEKRAPPLRKIDEELLSVDCEPQGLASEPHAYSEKFGIGAQADSTYEYLPKMYALLGAQVQQYKSMYMEARSAIRQHLLFRPMILEEDRKILFASKYEVYKKQRGVMKDKDVTYEVTHLSCFVGGMFALGAKIFEEKEDMELAKQLTDGCVWAYDSMPYGVMAEEAAVVPCPSLEACPWNQTRWEDLLDPQEKERFAAVEDWNKNQKTIRDKSELQAASAVGGGTGSLPLKTATPSPINNSGLKKKKRQEHAAGTEGPSRTSPLPQAGHDDVNAEGLSFVPKVALSHDKYVKARIQEERLPPGYTAIIDRKYGLRPEAIESVFYMYRLTGDETWRQKGWQMFEAVQRATQTDAGNAAMKDVTSHLMKLEDKMESFWLAETLKYFYLLFSEPSLISLDEYVLNTEAHPFKLPK